MKELYHWISKVEMKQGPGNYLYNADNIWGNCTGITGNAQHISGNVSTMSGDISGLTGDVTDIVVHARGEMYIGDVTYVTAIEDAGIPVLEID
jgi:hypothetical protein